MIYLISGLGADERVFQSLDLSEYDKKFIRWLDPKKGESLTSYCHRLTLQIAPDQEVILVGVSFGGIIAQEIAKLVSCKLVIIISSIKSINEFSWTLKLARATQIHRVIPSAILLWANKLTADYYFGVRSEHESRLLQQIIDDTNPKFLRWAIHQIMNWKQQYYLENLVHIHGSADRIFPIKKILNAIEIPNGGHFMIVSEASKIEQLIFAELNRNQDGPRK